MNKTVTDHLIVGWIYGLDGGRSLNDVEIGCLMVKGLLIQNPDLKARQSVPFVLSEAGMKRAKELGI